MNTLDTKANPPDAAGGSSWARLGLLRVLTCLLLAGPAWGTEESDHHFVGEGTLGVQFYDIDAPYDTSNVAGFFEQYRYIRDQGATLPYFLDLLHFDVGVQRADDTYLIRAERWSRNALNSNGYLDVGWRGLDLGLDYRRYRSDSLRFFPKGTWAGAPNPPDAYGVQYNSDLCPPEPGQPSPCADEAFGLRPSQIFDENHRIYVTRQSVGGQLALRPEGFSQRLPFLSQFRARARYETRKGYRQDSFVLARDQENPPPGDLNQSFRGNRRKINQEVTSAGTTLVISPFDLFEGSLAFDFQKFREEAPTVTRDANPPYADPPLPAPDGERAFFFVPDTNRYTGTIQLSKRTNSMVLNAGVSAARLEQTGRLSPLESFYGLCEGRGSTCDNAITLVSAHLDAKAPLLESLNVYAWMKYTYRNSDQARQDFLNDAFAVIGSGFQESPYIQERNQTRGGLELAFAPRHGAQLAVGYRFDWVDRDLLFPSDDGFTPGIQKSVSLIEPLSFDSEIFLRFRLRGLRSLQIGGEYSQSWASKVAYPNDLSDAIRFRLRGSYSLAHQFSLPITLSLTGHVLDGKNDEFPLPTLPNTTADPDRTNQFERTTWGYDISLTAVPSPAWVVFATFSQNVDEQSFGYVRSDFARYYSGLGIPINFYIDSFPNYRSNVKSLTFGASLGAWHALKAEASASLTWVNVGARGEDGVGSNVGQLIDGANRIEDRILTLNSELTYRVNDHVEVGAGYRFQQFINGIQFDPIDLNETVHTISAQLTVNFAGLSASLKGEN